MAYKKHKHKLCYFLTERQRCAAASVRVSSEGSLSSDHKTSRQRLRHRTTPLHGVTSELQQNVIQKGEKGSLTGTFVKDIWRIWEAS